MVPAVNKRFFKSFNLISRKHDLMLEAVQVPVVLLPQLNPLHHLADFVLHWAIFWMVRRPRNNQEIARTITVHHRVVNVRAVMCRKIVPNERPMKISAGDIICLDIHAHVVAKVAEYIGGGSNGT
jgi:hypothetical protein